MTIATQLLSSPADLAPWAAAWDELPLSRGDQADLFDSFAWLGAWLGADPSAAGRVRAVLALEGETLAAALPLVAEGPRRWCSAGIGFRPRFRPALRGIPREETIDALAAALARAGVRDLLLTALPTRDPATPMLEAALRRAGFEVGTREGSSECFSRAAPSFEEHARDFRKYARTVSNFTNKAARLGRVELRGAGGAEAVAEAFATYRALHARGWKGALREPMASFRRELLARAAALGWARPFTMTVAGVPVASMLWFRLGEVAVAYSTVYDERMAALSPGSIAMWRAHEAIFAEGNTAMVDYLPGHGPQKDQLGTERPALVSLEASRRGPVGAAVVRTARRLRGAAARVAPRPRKESDGRVEGAEPRIGEGQPGKAPRCLLEPLELSAYSEIFLAVAGGFASPQKMRDGWAEGDRWLRVGEPPLALARVAAEVDGASEVREVVALIDDGRLSRVLDALADLAGAPLRVPVRVAPFPWKGNGTG